MKIRKHDGGGIMVEEKNFDEQMDVIVLTLDDDTEMECAVIAIFPLESKEYIALASLEEDQQILFYEFFEDEDKDILEISVIENQEEFDRVCATFLELMDEDDHPHDHDHQEDHLEEDNDDEQEDNLE